MPDILGQLNVDPDLDASLAQQLRDQLAWLIASGQLAPGDRLPSVRDVAHQLTIHINTVRSAYGRLETEGLVMTRQGVGSDVVAQFPARLRQARPVRTHTVGVILPALENPFYHALLQGIEEGAHLDPVMLFVCSAHEDPDEACRQFAQLVAKDVDGIISAGFGPPTFQDPDEPLKSKPALPLVTVDSPGSAGHSVLLDLEGAGYAGTRHLLEHGHRRIGLVTYSRPTPNVLPVEGGYLRALRQANIEPDPALKLAVDGFGISEGAEAARRAIALPQPPTALFTIADMLALGVLGALRQAGVRVPTDIALASFNDIALAELTEPSLTTVAAPAREMGMEAMRMLHALIAGKRPARKRIVLPVSLVVRKSCGCHSESPRGSAGH